MKIKASKSEVLVLSQRRVEFLLCQDVRCSGYHDETQRKTQDMLEGVWERPGIPPQELQQATGKSGPLSWISRRQVGNMVVLKVMVVLVVGFTCWAEEQKELSVSELLWRANKDVVHTEDEPLVIDDIAYNNENERNADQCTSRGCLWPKSADGKVYIPYVIANHYTSRELSVIERGLESFSDVSCIRFTRRSSERDYLSIQSHNGCYSYVGRLGYGQTLSLDRAGCIYHSTVQHELLHALGFNHEQCRSDRDQYIRILWENIQSGLAYAFDKLDTLNLNTPYDYNSVMQYHRYAFSANNQPTMVPIPDSNVSFGTATEMSKNDITRLNRLYNC